MQVRVRSEVQLIRSRENESPRHYLQPVVASGQLDDLDDPDLVLRLADFYVSRNEHAFERAGHSGDSGISRLPGSSERRGWD